MLPLIRLHRLIFVLLLACAELAGLTLAAQSGPPKNYVLQWSENFPNGVLDVTKWNYRTDIKGTSAQLPANVSIDSSGHLNIALRQQSFAGKEFTGGGIVSKAAFRYGYFEVKAKTTTNPGWHSAFWLFAGDGATTYAPQGLTEIDDFEIDSQSPDVISMGRLEWLNGKAISGKRCNPHYKPGWSTAAGYHVYGLEWTEEAINYYLDGSMICSQPYPYTEYTHDPLNIWLTAIGLSPNTAITDPASMVSFSNAAFYIRDYYIQNGDPGYVEYGPGWQDSSTPGYSKSKARVSCQAQSFATYTPTILEQGNYDVQVFQVQGANVGPAAQVTVRSREQTVTKTLAPSTDGNRWFDLGVAPFGQGSGGSLTIMNSGKGCTTASMVKFVRR
jgi:beta-glucanase (GH16 family)